MLTSMQDMLWTAGLVNAIKGGPKKSHPQQCHLQFFDELVRVSGGVLVCKDQLLTASKWNNQTRLTDRVNSYIMCELSEIYGIADMTIRTRNSRTVYCITSRRA